MDPYIEYPAIWVDFHNRLADEISAQLNMTIRPNYFARLTPRTTYDVVEISQVRAQVVRPDWVCFSGSQRGRLLLPRPRSPKQ